MAGKKDPLIYAIGRARLSGPSSDVHGKKRCARLFVRELRATSSGVQKWSNVTNAHVAKVVDRWKERGLLPGTIKNYLTAVRDLCKAFGNERIHPGNAAFGVTRRVYVSNQDKAVPQEVYERVVDALSASEDPCEQRMGLMLKLQRVFGMRFEESYKFNPLRDDLGSQAHIHRGAKGGRPRWTTIWNDAQRELLGRAKESPFYTGPADTLIPEGVTESQWRDRTYRTVRELGLSRKACGASLHGLRHAYAPRSATACLPGLRRQRPVRVVRSSWLRLRLWAGRIGARRTNWPGASSARRWATRRTATSTDSILAATR